MTRKILVLFLLLPLLASCGWHTQCTKRTSYVLGEEKTASVGSEMVQLGCFVMRHEPTGLNKDFWNRTAYDFNVVNPMILKELLYSGRAGNILHITYREYIRGGYIKPAFTQMVQYDFKASDMIVFQDWVLQVIDANNQTIRFRVTTEPPQGDWYF